MNTPFADEFAMQMTRSERAADKLYHACKWTLCSEGIGSWAVSCTPPQPRGAVRRHEGCLASPAVGDSPHPQPPCAERYESSCQQFAGMTSTSSLDLPDFHGRRLCETGHVPLSPIVGSKGARFAHDATYHSLCGGQSLKRLSYLQTLTRQVVDPKSEPTGRGRWLLWWPSPSPSTLPPQRIR